MRHHGFTLLEALITLTLLAILSTLSYSTLHAFISRTQDDIMQEKLLDAIALANQEARLRRMPVVLCSSKNHKTCSSLGADDWLIFVDESEEGVIKDKDHILMVTQIKAGQGKLYSRSYPRYRPFLLFLPTGLMRTDNSTFWFCHQTAASPVWAIILNKSGKTRVTYPDKEGVIKDGHGLPLTCDVAYQH